MAGIERGSRLLVMARIADALSVPLPKLLSGPMMIVLRSPPVVKGVIIKRKRRAGPRSHER